MRFTNPYLLNAMLTWGFYYFAGVDKEKVEGGFRIIQGMAGFRMYTWLVLATARSQDRNEAI